MTDNTKIRGKIIILLGKKGLLTYKKKSFKKKISNLN